MQTHVCLWFPPGMMLKSGNSRTDARMERKLIAIMAADVVGYSALMEADETATLRRLQAALSQVVRPTVTGNRGRIVKLMGDGMLSRFDSARDAARAAIAIQTGLAGLDPELKLRIGLHLGDVMVTGNDILGDGVNIACRLQTLARPGGITISRQLRDQIARHGFGGLVANGPQSVKNLARPIETFSIPTGQETADTGNRLCFDDFELDLADFTLHRDGTPVHVEPLVFDFLRCLVQNAGHTVTRDAAIEQVWKGRIVSDATVASCLKAARKALGDDGERQKYIRTIRGRGFRFLAHPVRSGPAATPAAAPPASPGPARAGNRSLAVLPFRAARSDGPLAEMAEDLSDSLSTVLTRVPMLAVLSARAIAGRPEASFLVEGGLRRTGDGLRADIRLVRGDTGVQVWGQQFLRPDRGDPGQALLFDVLARLEPSLVKAMLDDHDDASRQDSAAGLLIKSMGLLAVKGWHRTTFEEAADMLRRSIALDPANPYAHSHLALILALGHRFGALPKNPATEAEALREAETALEQDSEDSTVVSISACAIADLGQTARAVPLLKKAIALNPNNAHAWAALGSAHMMLRRNREAIEALETGVRLAPLDTRLAVWMAVLALVYLLDGDVTRAAETADLACQQDDRNHLPRLALTAVHLAAGNTGAARTACAETLRTKPDLTRNELLSFLGKTLGEPVLTLCDALGQPRLD